MQSLTITPVDLAPIPFIERCDYNEFLAQLAARHGPGYLCRPDGTLLDGVVTIPEVKPKRQAKRQAPTLPDGYTGNQISDFHRRGIRAARWTGVSQARPVRQRSGAGSAEGWPENPKRDRADNRADAWPGQERPASMQRQVAGASNK
jgi:hypothetical protein